MQKAIPAAAWKHLLPYNIAHEREDRQILQKEEHQFVTMYARTPAEAKNSLAALTSKVVNEFTTLALQERPRH